MLANSSGRSLSFVALCVSIAVAVIFFGVRVAYTPLIYYSLAVIQLGIVCFTAWKLGVWAIKSEVEASRMLAIAGGLLITALALKSVLPGIGPPGVQSNAENQLRYLILIIDSLAVAGGFVVLRETLSRAGESSYSTLGFGAIMLAAPAYLVWGIFMLAFYRAAGLASSGEVPSWINSHNDLSDLFLFFGGILTYLATAAFAASLGRIQWLSRRATYIFVTASFLAILLLATRGLGFPNPSVAFTHWYTIPGWVAGIPAIPWIMPCIFGVILLRRAGNKQS